MSAWIGELQSTKAKSCGGGNVVVAVKRPATIPCTSGGARIDM
jgi:hypothetical protein